MTLQRAINVSPVALAVFVLLTHTEANAQVQSLSLNRGTLSASGGDIPLRQDCYAAITGGDPSRIYRIDMRMFITSPSEYLGDLAGYGWGQAYVSMNVTTHLTRDNRVVTCEANFNGSAWDSRSLTYAARRPVSLGTVLDQFRPFGFANYRRDRTYKVNDNYGYAYGYTDTTVNESWTISSSNACRIGRVEVGSKNLRFDGTFDDTYAAWGLGSLPGCESNPSCTSTTFQTIYVSTGTFNKTAIWSCNNVQVN